MHIYSFCSTEKVNLRRIDGHAKVVGTLVCITGAILMAVFRGPALFGYKESEFTAQIELTAKDLPEPVGLLFSSFLEVKIDDWQIGVLCLIGNCMCMAVYLAIQVIRIDLEVHNLLRIYSFEKQICYPTHQR